MVNFAKRFRKPTGSAQIIEFGSALYLLTLALLIPIVGMSGLLISLLVGQLATSSSAEQAVCCASYDQALKQVAQELNRSTQCGLGSVAHLRLLCGYHNSGVDLYIDGKDKVGQTTISYGPNTPLKKPADPAKTVYSYRVVSHLQAGPLIPIAGLNLAYVTSPVNLQFTSSIPVERPGSLNIRLDSTLTP